jgi:hypothetical protein
MEEFDPTRPGILHDRLNDQIIKWDAEPDQVANFRMNAEKSTDGLVVWNGFILDGWSLRPSPELVSDLLAE